METTLISAPAKKVSFGNAKLAKPEAYMQRRFVRGVGLLFWQFRPESYLPVAERRKKQSIIAFFRFRLIRVRFLGTVGF